VSSWPSTRARRVLASLLRIGWQEKRRTGSHRTLARPGWPDVVFAFHDDETLGPRMLARILDLLPKTSERDAVQQ
jgi:predicted RNA binding protein YcfA (HicA-like mRNA interferase family)